MKDVRRIEIESTHFLSLHRLLLTVRKKTDVGKEKSVACQWRYNFGELVGFQQKKMLVFDVLERKAESVLCV